MKQNSFGKIIISALLIIIGAFAFLSLGHSAHTVSNPCPLGGLMSSNCPTQNIASFADHHATALVAVVQPMAGVLAALLIFFIVFYFDTTSLITSRSQALFASSTESEDRIVEFQRKFLNWFASLRTRNLPLFSGA